MFDHEHHLHRTDSDLERQQRMDENRASSDLGYPVANLHRSRFGPHPFSASANPRNARCEKCGRTRSHSIHSTTQEQAA